MMCEIRVAADATSTAAETCHDAIGVAPEGVVKQRLEDARQHLAVAARLIGEAFELAQPALTRRAEKSFGGVR